MLTLQLLVIDISTSVVRATVYIQRMAHHSLNVLYSVCVKSWNTRLPTRAHIASSLSADRLSLKVYAALYCDVTKP